MGHRSFTTADLAAQRAEWDALDREVECYLRLHAPLLETVRARVAPLWEALVEGKTFARKPSYGLRLFGADDHTLVGISPSYKRHTKTVESCCHRVEVLGEVERYLAPVAPRPFYQLERRLTLVVYLGGATWKLLRKSAVADLETLVPILEDFLIDPDSVLRRSTTYCAICGRHLTDGQSRARGVGPECLHHVSTWFAYTESLFGGADQP